jgi:tetratricopeptide (TPR) repeat protein
MVRRVSARLLWVSIFAVALLALALPAAAQSTGMVKGVVKDAQGQPVEGAKVSIDMTEGVSRHFETKSNKKGEFVQIGLPPGNYMVSAEKDKTPSNQAPARVSISRPSEVALVIGGGGGGAAGKEAAAKMADLKKAFEEGIAAGQAGKHDDAIAAFTKASEINPKCYDCQYNIGYMYTQKKEYDKAEESYKKAIELKPDYAEAYSGLANIYNLQRKFDLAAEASKKAGEIGGGAAAAGGAGNADAMYNQGVILWNAGKIADAKKQFEAAVAAKPDHAEAHYQLGMALVNEGNLTGAATEFETYLKLAPSGPNAATAKGILGTIKK